MNNITLNLCENKIHTFKNFDNFIYYIFFNKKNFINKGKLKTYIKFHFHRVDDKRCKKYAENIKKFINQKNNETSFNRFVYIILIFFRFPRNFKYSYFIVKS